MKNVEVAALLVAAIVAGAGAGYLIGVDVSRSQTGDGMPTTSMSTSTTCHITGETWGVALHVVAAEYSNYPNYYTTTPVAGAYVSAEGIFYCNDERKTTSILLATTNSSGWALLYNGGGGTYYLNITYPGSKLVYSLSVPVRPVTATYVTFNVSTGNTTTHFCQYNFHCTTGA